MEADSRQRTKAEQSFVTFSGLTVLLVVLFHERVAVLAIAAALAVLFGLVGGRWLWLAKRERLGERSLVEPICGFCGYDLRRNESAQCPECGVLFSRRRRMSRSGRSRGIPGGD